MRNDPVLPAAVILRLRGPGGQEFFVVVTWDLDPQGRHMIGRYPSLQEADAAVLWSHPSPMVPGPNEDDAALRRRKERQALELEHQQRAREMLYGP